MNKQTIGSGDRASLSVEASLGEYGAGLLYRQH